MAGAGAGWIGARLAELDLVIDLDVRADAIVASGVLLNRPQDTIHDAVPLAPAIIARQHRSGPATSGIDGGVPAADREANAAASDAGIAEDAGVHRPGHGSDAREIPDAHPSSSNPIKSAK